ncbi:MAG: hypothetical protein KDC49_11190 [Saprospiraceae bacterium]|nr:hypothetical protein [Saprospiraceae bacterium]
MRYQVSQKLKTKDIPFFPRYTLALKGTRPQDPNTPRSQNAKDQRPTPA